MDVQKFRDQGYLVLREAIDPAALDPFIRVLDERVDAVARDHLARGLIDQSYADLPFERRLAAVYDGRDLVTREWNSSLRSPEFLDLVRSKSIVDSLTPLLGPKVSYQGNAHLRPYLPRHLPRLPWHQDAQFYGPGIEHMLWNIVQLWLPLVDAGVDQGCLALVPGSHHWGLLDTTGAEDDPERIYRHTAERVRFEPVQLIPLRKGDLLVFTNLLAHTGTENRSSTIRWSVDIRFEATLGARPLSPEEELGYAVTRRRMTSRGAAPVPIS